MTELDIYKAFAKYMRIIHPKVIFHFDFGSGTYLSHKQASEQKAINPIRGYPDLFISEIRAGKHGMFVEVKREGVKTHTKQGNLVANEHIREQAAMLERLNKRGYHAVFAFGYEHLIKVVEDYLKNNL
jgi:hypothetical protein